MADAAARIRELEKRVEREPGSRYFVPLAEEHRKAGRLAEAIKALEAGLLLHEGYVAARIALARAYLEAGRIDDSVAAFSKALAEDPSNLVAAKALGDLHLSRGETLEALKRYLRYRAVSGDRRLDGVIERLQAETATGGPAPELPSATPPPPPERPTTVAASPITPPPALVDPMAIVPPFGAAPGRETDPGDISGVSYERPSGPVTAESDAPEVHSRAVSLDSLAASRRDDDEIITRKIRLPEAMWPFEPAAPPEPVPPPAVPEAPAPEEDSTPPTGRTLADLYFEQEHYSEAARVYEELLAADPDNSEIRGRRDEALRRAEGAFSASLPAPDPGRERRLEKIRVLNEWIARIRAVAR